MTTQKPLEDEDLDDLDDVLDQFTPAPSKQQATLSPPPQAAASTVLPSTSKSPPLPSTDADAGGLAPGLAEDFAREFAKGMESFMREMGSEDGMAMDDWLVQDDGVNREADKTGGKDDFQKTIKQAMEKLKESESTLKTDASSSNSNADPLEALLAQLGTGDGESEEELHGLLETMMGQLMSKEVLYEPLKELHDKYPAYLKDHPDLPTDDKRRYQSQYQSISKIIALFDDPGYKEDDPRVIGLMTEMQSFGSPPPEIMGPMPPGFGFGPEGTPDMPEGCIIA